MAKTKQGKKDVDLYTIRGTNKVVRVGDCVLMRPSDSDNQPYVARVEKMEADGRGSVRVRVRWYYRPEESKGGRRQFHGAKELFLSDHFDLQSAHTIEGKCVVHSFKNYTKLDNVGPEDFFCRFEYKAATGSFTPDRVAVYCKCEMPYNPDDLMVQCDACKDWFHPSCMGMTIEQAKKLDHFVCSDCVKENGSKRLSNAYATSPNSEPKEQCGLGTRRHPGGGIGGPQRRMPRRGAVAGACGRAAPAQIWPWRPGWAHESCGGSWWWWGNCSLLLPSICCMLQQIHRSHQAAAQFNPSRARIEKQQ
ncbi:hypothetical protein PAHAL_6G201500 [Panicum hallii]|uniref:BAH domain-containing protein n=1 Tax=Panicum hallii TaxID=206008 RepID=A0A2T8IH43_9POAL|nr:hypothetical protein PAHAL_6G201500 [Panicum hallii]